MEFDTNSTWKLNYCQPAVFHKQSDNEVSNDDEDSVASDSSRITATYLDMPTMHTYVAVVMPSSPPGSPLASANRSPADIALEKTPTDKRRVQRNAPNYCHDISKLNCITGGIATEIDFSCKCFLTLPSYTNQLDYMLKQSDKTDCIQPKRQMDNFELNWHLLMATQPMGESQIGGSIIEFFLDLTREVFPTT
jgi:hypothetical protein